jgi:hypothetical protein
MLAIAVKPRGARARLVRHLTRQDFTRGDDGGERTRSQNINGGETSRITRTNVLRRRLFNHTVRGSTVVVLLHRRHQTETHRAHDGKRIRAHNLAPTKSTG